MKAAVVLATLGLVLLVDAAPQLPSRSLEQDGPIYKNEQRDDYGQYSLSYGTNTGHQATESLHLKAVQVGTETVYVPVIQGEYQYVDKDGHPVKLRYFADENGYQAMGDHLPVAPAIPQPTQ